MKKSRRKRPKYSELIPASVDWIAHERTLHRRMVSTTASGKKQIEAAYRVGVLNQESYEAFIKEYQLQEQHAAISGKMLDLIELRTLGIATSEDLHLLDNLAKLLR